MGKATLINNTGFSVQVKEGNSNILRVLQVLKSRKSMTIQVDSSATYREYVLTVLPDNKKLRLLSSDDIQELSAIEIFQDEDTCEYDWRELRGGAEKKSLFGFFLGLFSRKPGANPGAIADATIGANPGANVDATIGANLGANLGANADATVGANAGATVGANAGANADATVGANADANVDSSKSPTATQ